ncbi:MAG: HPF/RaiA family ribosome-associated protein [Pirellula sp.]|jgi:ribosome-associated translation inhibitor RaiA|nr:HPF/RaiA family ribosome-associated protein [Pirellula sp.]
MQLCIHTHGIDLTDAIKKQTYQKLELALDRLEGKICDISVTLVDTNGPFLGGVDKACRIEVHIRDQDPIIIEDCDESVDEVIERITDRLGVVACQRLDVYRRLKSQRRNWIHHESME